MEHLVEQLVTDLPLWILFGIIAVSLFALAQGADLLVEEAVTLSAKWGVPKILIGATIVSLGTTLPEAAVSVFAAVQGNPGLALGNAVGSVICDTGLILGLATVIAPLPLDRRLVNRQGNIQLGAGVLLVVLSLPFSSLTTVMETGGRLPQQVGFLFIGMLVVYIWFTIRWAKTSGADSGVDTEARAPEIKSDAASLPLIGIKLAFAIGLVVVSSQILIPTVEETALRLNVPDSIIAATLVAFGTSLPELVTAISAVVKKHGELALGNIIGADILNVFFVAGAAASVTSEGLEAPVQFFRLLFPAMLFILVVFRSGVALSGTHLQRPFGFVLLGCYLAYAVLSFAEVGISH